MRTPCKHHSSSVRTPCKHQDFQELDLDMGDLDLTTEEIDMEEVDDDLKLFQQVC